MAVSLSALWPNHFGEVYNWRNKLKHFFLRTVWTSVSLLLPPQLFRGQPGPWYSCYFPYHLPLEEGLDLNVPVTLAFTFPKDGLDPSLSFTTPHIPPRMALTSVSLLLHTHFPQVRPESWCPCYYPFTFFKDGLNLSDPVTNSSPSPRTAWPSVSMSLPPLRVRHGPWCPCYYPLTFPEDCLDFGVSVTTPLTFLKNGLELIVPVTTPHLPRG